MNQKITSCEFNDKQCSSNCSNYTLCAILNTEKHINSLELKISSLFESINQILEFSSVNGNQLISLREIIPEKQDVLEQFSVVYEEIKSVKKLVIESNKEMKNLILEYSNELKNFNERISLIEKSFINEKGKDSNVL